MHRDFLKEKAEAESGNIPKALVATEHYNVFEVKTPMFTYRYALMHNVGFIWLLKQDFQLKEPFKASNGFTIFSDYVATWVEIDKTLLVRGTVDTADKTQPLVIKNMGRNIGLFKALDEFTVFVNKPRVDVGKYHTEMWTLISQGVTKGDACKRVAEKYGLPEPDGSCFLCWKTQLDGTGITDCKLCLLKGHWGYGAISCLHTGSYYKMWEQEKDVTLRRALAKRIADLPNSINPQLNDHELQLLRTDGRIPAIKAFRDRTGLDLKTAKEIVTEELRRNNPIF